MAASAAAVPAASNPAGAGARLSIGQVLSHLQGEFGDLTPSKLRFLEEQGLVTPERTRSGYRKFSQAHVERLRLILTLQRDHYLPLKVIAEVLDEVDQGRDPVIPGAAPRSASSILMPRRLLGREELQQLTGASSRFLGEAIAAGLLPAAEVFPHDAVAEVTALLRLAEQGITPRHLRAVRVAAEREAELIEHAVSSRGVRGGTPHSTEDALAIAAELETVRSGVLKRRLTGR
ncbi:MULTISPECIES: MerR family transcriptional regulator [Leucobacter]|uniref:MerR family transcriptional regulator n=1 Tax=Leucobacter iarius TaxID=333963 RepID=A0ABN2LM97_9MICO|nr:MerR family transcriptional regulator [Leucobacter sp. Ag1]KKI20185.1 MerR family transcriptional regulator [Leucobacter sp. Ag1]